MRSLEGAILYPPDILTKSLVSIILTVDQEQWARDFGQIFRDWTCMGPGVTKYSGKWL